MPKPKGSTSPPGSDPPSAESGGARTQDVDPGGPAPSLFQPGDDNTVRGELVVKLAPSGQASVTESVPATPLRGLTVGVPRGLGIPDVDAVLERYNAHAVAQVHPPRSSFSVAAAE